jgi:signal transduction histidine kinase
MIRLDFDLCGKALVATWLRPICFVLAVASSQVAAADSAPKVLVLFSTTRDAGMSITGDRELPRILSTGLHRPVDYSSEHLAIGRTKEPEYQAAFSQLLRLKYSGVRFDLVIAFQDSAVRFMTAYGKDLFPQTPIVYLVTSPDVPALPHATGVIAQLDVAGTVAFMTDLQPDLAEIFVVSGTAFPDRDYEIGAKKQFAALRNTPRVTFLAGLPTRELDAKLASLPSHSAVYYLTVYQDGAGEGFNPLEYQEHVARVANAPTYSWIESSMGHGVIGGSLLTIDAMLQAVAEPAIRVLQGERADQIGVRPTRLYVREVDWRELAHWSIDPSHVPAGTIVEFREASFWSQYRRYIMVAGTVIVAQTLLIGALLVQRRRRYVAEAQVRHREAALRVSYDRVRDLGGRLLRAQERERLRIAGELHDNVSQQLTVLALDLEFLMQRHPDAAPLAGDALTRTRDLCDDVRNLSHSLHPARVHVVGLRAGIESLIRELPRSGPAVTFTPGLVPDNLSSDLTLCFFRVVQEALQNAIKYSQAHTIHVSLWTETDMLRLRIIDDGVGFDVDAAPKHGLGLISMRERAESIAATIQITSQANAGTTIEISARLRREADSVKPAIEEGSS